jgi:hypothetical protein
VSRALAVAGCVLAFAAQGCGDDDDPVETTAPIEEDVLWPPPDRTTDDPRRTARSFVEEYIGVADPALSEFADKGDGTGEIDIHRRGEDGRKLATVVSTLSLRQLDEGWAVASAVSDEVELTEPTPSGEIASPVRVAGRGRGFEGNVVLEVRKQYALDPLVQKPVIAGAFEELEPFSAQLAFDPSGAVIGAIVATTGSGITAADGFAAFPVRFRPG